MSSKPQTEDRRFGAEAEYARKGTKTWSWARLEAPNLRNWYGANFFLYNGEVQIFPGGQEDVFFLTRSPDNSVAEPEPASLSGEHDLRLILKLWAGGKGQLTEITATTHAGQGGDTILQLRWTYRTTKSSSRCWVVPDQNWTIQRYEVRTPGGGLGTVCEVFEYETSNGLAYPKRGRRTEYLLDTQAVGSTIDFEVLKLETLDANVPDRLFQFEFPKEAQIWDVDRKTYIRNTELTESQLAELIRRLGPPPRPWLRWLLVMLIAIGSAAVALMIRKRWRR